MKSLLPRVPYKSLRFQLISALMLILSGMLAATLFTLYEIELRKHDYLILNLTGQLRVLSQTMVKQSLYFQEQTENAETRWRFRREISEQSLTFDRIIQSLQAKTIPPEFSGLSEPILCTWDDQSIRQLNKTNMHWQAFYKKLMPLLKDNPSPEQYLATAQIITQNEKELLSVASNLATAFQLMMEDKLQLMKVYNQIVLLLSCLIAVVLVLALYKRIIRPVDESVAALKQIALGNTDVKLPENTENEVGQLATGVNQLADRLNGVFRLTEKVSGAHDLDTTLRFVYEEFRVFLPLDWIGFLSLDEAENYLRIERIYTEMPVRLNTRTHYRFASDSAIKAALDSRRLQTLSPDHDKLAGRDEICTQLFSDELQHVIVLPMDRQYALLIASGSQAYSAEQKIFLQNIAGQLVHSFEKTIALDNVVISAVSGMARLAENHDAETAGHLERMRMYSNLIAEELAGQRDFRQIITPEYLRNIDRFAAMHDIGKVGIADRILHKQGALDEIERGEMNRHVMIGADVLRRCQEQIANYGQPLFQAGIEIAEGHHEKFDGSGYPYGLQGNEIPLSARIVAAADVFDALASKRAYKQAWQLDECFQHMQIHSGSHFDPRVVKAMLSIKAHIQHIYNEHKHV